MAKDFSSKFYKSKQWQHCREAFISHRISVDGGLCQNCGKDPGFIVHHKTYLDPSNMNDQSILLSFDNLEYWCLSCHSALHYSKRNSLLCGFDENGRPIDVSTK